MKKIDNWEELVKDGDEVVSFDSLPIGPQICKILVVEDKSDKEYLKIQFDIADGDFKGHFKDQKEQFKNDDWPSGGTGYRSYKSTAYSFFTAFIIAVERSNPKFKWDWDEQKLVNMLFVANFGEEDYLDEVTNEIKTSIKCREFRSIKALKEGTIKPLKKKELSDANKQKIEAGDTGGNKKNKTEVIDVSEDDLPF